ncbi:MAG: sulfite oxidase-like oxidoreductase [Acidobacteria bacterium]|nr:sulfite oxidase-like oxidoreductase [Acidobacteriota bacterium]
MLFDLEKLQGTAVPAPDGLPADVIISPDTRRDERIPPRQARTRKWPVLDAFGAPKVDLRTWEFKVSGLVEHPLSFNWEEFQKLPRVKVFADFHCVTRWSRLGNLWEGVSAREIIARAKPLAATKFVVAHGFDHSWTTNMPFEFLQAEDALFAITHDGEPISHEHGGPCRLIIPRLYAWKSAKWIKAIEFVAEDRAGYWEEGGYHMLGDPWREQRFRTDS